MNSKLEFLNKLFTRYKKNERYKSVIFFKHNIFYYIVWIEILRAHYNKKKITLFELYKRLMLENLSKETASKIIKHSIQKQYLLKKKDELDKRRSYIYASSKLIEEFELYYSELTQI